ncbi:nuclear transport factor 2 family protein [Neptunicoccus cionae]|uniref:nuclear transport factor 2 family protein n=1 Tax=Neptunicoccus cionae TaxID=2035344 RepID=UPI000C79377C|nr:nuclear transport factor 2 family protein [Amylibacter cionae]PLS23623.1 DUF4440 domain-containing protein [Amylibacter cionae]
MLNHPNLRALHSLFEAFNNHDIDGVMHHFTPEAIFDTASGPTSSGTRVMGKENIRKVFSDTFERFSDSQWEILFHKNLGDNRAVSNWIYTATDPNGDKVALEGVDIFVFENGQIVHKNVFRKAPG